jgi:asparagine synthase (glutamine-hydrolysing)
MGIFGNLRSQSLSGFQSFSIPDSSDFPFSVLFDGRLDNRRELISLLELGPDPDDSEILASAYRKWGSACAAQLLGDFAFAIWDASQKRLVLSRDYLGIKPLYYHWNGRAFYFSSEIQALFEYPEIKKEPNPAAIAALLTGDLQDPEATFFRGISHLRPAHTLIFDAAANLYHQERYWHPEPKKSPARDFKETYRSLFLEAVKSRMQSSAPVGLLFSGGLDSTQIASAAAWSQQKDNSLPVLVPVTWLPNGILNEDLEAIAQFECHYGIKTEFITPGPESRERSNMDYFCETGETPHPDCFSAVSFLLQPLRSKGCTRVLAGTGGNELGFYAEIGFLHDLLLQGRGISFARETSRLAASLNISNREAWTWLASETLREKLPQKVRSLWKKRYHLGLTWMKPDLRRTLPENSVKRKPAFEALTHEMVWRELSNPWFALSLNQMDYEAAQYGMEMAHPFLDRRLVEFLFSVPGPVKTQAGYRKMFFQKALQPVVQTAFRAGDRTDCAVPDNFTELSAPFQAQRLKFYLSNPDLFIYSYVEYTFIQAYLDPSRPDFWSHHSLLWRLVRLETWFRRHFSNSHPLEKSRYERNPRPL